AVDILTHVLGATSTGRLYRAVVEPKLATSVSAQAYQLREPGVLLVGATVPQDGDLPAVQRAIDATLDSLLTSRPVTAEEVERGRAALLRGIELQFTNASSVGLNLSEWAAMGDWRLIFLHRDRIKAVTAEDVMRVAHAYLKR